MAMKDYSIAIVGATGLVGTTFLKVLEERQINVASMNLFASPKSAGRTLMFQGKMLQVQPLTKDSLDAGYDVVLFSAGGAVSKEYAYQAVASGSIVVDNSSAWRMDPSVPLVVPEVNVSLLRHHPGLIANPNCSTIQSVVALGPIYKTYGLTKIVYTTFQAVSGSGYSGLRDLERAKQGEAPEFYPVPIDRTVYPKIDEFVENLSTKEEVKMIQETKKILGDDSIAISATCVRVGIEHAHSVAITLETKRPFAIVDMIELLKQSPSIKVYDHPAIPTVLDAAGNDVVHVGRIRRDDSVENGLQMWVVSDNIRKGAATNAIQIVEAILGEQV
jgi:aspartate-semialdehyde dehydrogenase